MSIIRAPRPDRGFTILDNKLLRMRELSFKARGLHAFILSHTDGWKTDADSLAGASDKDGRAAVLSGLKELEEARLVVRVRWQNARGHWRTDTLVFDQPVPDDFDPATVIDGLRPRDPDEFSTGERDPIDGDAPTDEQLFDAAAFAQVTPEVENRTSVPSPEGGFPTSDNRPPNTGEDHGQKTSVVNEAGETPGSSGSTPPAPGSGPAPGSAAPRRDHDEFGPLTPYCERHPGGTADPCRACANRREAFPGAQRRRDSAAAIQADRQAKGRAVPSDAPEVKETLAEARARIAAARERLLEPPGTDPAAPEPPVAP